MATLGMLIFILFVQSSPVLAAVGLSVAVYGASQWTVDWEGLVETAFFTAAVASLVLILVVS